MLCARWVSARVVVVVSSGGPGGSVELAAMSCMYLAMRFRVWIACLDSFVVDIWFLAWVLFAGLRLVWVGPDPRAVFSAKSIARAMAS